MQRHGNAAARQIIATWTHGGARYERTMGLGRWWGWVTGLGAEVECVGESWVASKLVGIRRYRVSTARPLEQGLDLGAEHVR
jgi:hypothetical protein